jgi:hypothetical protein
MSWLGYPIPRHRLDAGDVGNLARNRSFEAILASYPQAKPLFSCSVRSGRGRRLGKKRRR